MDQGTLNVISGIVIAIFGSGGIISFWRAKRAHDRSDLPADETQARTTLSLDFMDLTEAYRNEINGLEHLVSTYRRYCATLEEHIWGGKPPPPPARPKELE